MYYGVESQHFGVPEELMAAGELHRAGLDATPQMPSTWALTGAVVVGLSMYGALRAATATVGETADQGMARRSPLARKPRTSTVSMGLEVGDKMPPSVLSQCGVSGKNAVVFFYGADDAPSCSKEIGAFEESLDTFAEAGVTVVGVRNPKGAKEEVEENTAVTLVVDEDDEMRNEIGIEKDLFGLLGGRETYVIDKSGTIVSVHNNQFDPNSHVAVAEAALDELPQSSNPLDALLAALPFGKD